MALFAEDKIVFRVDLRDDPAVGELVGLCVPRQFEIHQLVEIGAAGHVGYILTHRRPAQTSAASLCPSVDDPTKTRRRAGIQP
ncbi:MAG: hypothetical protein ABSG65_01925 [Bryobacteraceae bacterium]